MKKFELAPETEKTVCGIRMFRIRALMSFGSIVKGALGGYIEKEDNLSQSNNAWVYGNAQVYGNAWVYGDAQVYGDARVHGNAIIEKFGECVNITNQKNEITLTPNRIAIGCKSWSSLDEFEKTYQQTGKNANYTDDESEMTAELVRAVMKRIGKQETKTISVVYNGQEFKIDIEKAKSLGLIE